MNCRMILRIVVAGGLTLLAACGIGKPMAIPVSEKELGPEPGDATGFVRTILDNLRKAGVQNTRKEQRLLFDELEPFAGEYIQAKGTYTENGQR